MQHLYTLGALASLCGVNPVVIRSLEEKGLIKPAKGHEQDRKRFSYEMRVQAKRLTDDMTDEQRRGAFNPVLAPGALAEAANNGSGSGPLEGGIVALATEKPATEKLLDPPKDRDDVVRKFEARRTYRTTELSAQRAQQVYDLWKKYRPSSRGQESAERKIVTTLRRTYGIAMQVSSLRKYLLALELVRPMPTRNRLAKGRVPHARKRRTPRLIVDNPLTREPTHAPAITKRMTAADLGEVTRVLNILEKLSPAAQQFVAQWLRS